LSNINLSKSRYTRGYQCPKMLYLDLYNSGVGEFVDNSAVFDQGREVGELAKGLFGKYYDVKYSDNLNDMINDTQKYLSEDKKIITEASFIYNNNFASVDILINNKNKCVEIYEVKSSTDVKDIYKEDLSYQVFILLSLGYTINKACIVHINPFYEYKDKFDIKKYFKIVDLTSYSINNYNNVKKNINSTVNILEKDKEPDIIIGDYCNYPYSCPYFKYCSNLKEGNIFDLSRITFKKKLEFYNKGIIYYKDIINSNINDKAKEEADFELNNKEDKIEIDKIKEFMKEFSYPIYFLDFETYQDAIPKFNVQRPFSQVPFQYSLHILDKDCKLAHKEYLSEAGIDPRRKLAESLVKDIPENACVVAYNMSFEKMVIKNLSEMYPDLKSNLMSIHSNLKDLMIPFYNRYYYTKDMHGSYSIKYVLPALFPNDKELDYSNLPLVHKGDQASNYFRTLSNYSKKEQKKIRHALLVYCELDTYAMVKIYEKLLSVIKK